MPSAADEVRRAIIARGGALPFDDFMSLALYGDGGFYIRSSDAGRTGMAGRRGDFITSPEVGPLFGTVMARAFDTWWEQLGRPDPFVVVEAGAGPGTLARSVLAARPACVESLRYVAVEVSATQRAMHPAGVESRATMPTEPFVGVIIANELLDNLPFRLFVHDGEWQEAHVGSDGERFVEVLRRCAALPSCLPVSSAHGARVAVQEVAAQWVADSLSLVTSGRVVVIDYSTTTEAMAQRPWREWLRTYASQNRGTHYLASVGEQDITAEVAVDQLSGTTSVETQADFLRSHGIEDLVAEGKQVWQRAASAPDVAAMKMRSRVSEAEALLDTNGLGGFSVMQWCC